MKPQCEIGWASHQIRKIMGCACAGNAGNVFPTRRLQRKPLVSDPGMHHGTCVTHVPRCMSGLLTCDSGENVPGIPGACAPAILRIWQEAHSIGTKLTTLSRWFWEALKTADSTSSRIPLQSWLDDLQKKIHCCHDITVAYLCHMASWIVVNISWSNGLPVAWRHEAKASTYIDLSSFIKPETQFNQIEDIFIQGNAFENAVSKTATIISWPQRVNH